MTAEQKGWYLELIIESFLDTEKIGYLPADEDKLRAIAGAIYRPNGITASRYRVEDFEQAWSLVRAQLKPRSGYTCIPSVLEVVKEREKIRKLRSEAGKKSVEVRREKRPPVTEDSEQQGLADVLTEDIPPPIYKGQDGRTWLPEKLEFSGDQRKRILFLAGEYFPWLEEAELSKKLRRVFIDFREYWNRMKEVDVQRRTKFGQKKDWYMTFVRNLKFVSDREAKFRSNDEAKSNGKQSISELRKDALRRIQEDLGDKLPQRSEDSIPDF